MFKYVFCTVISLFILCGVSTPDSQAKNEQSLFKALRYGDSESAKNLIEKSVNVNVKNNGGSTPLMAALRYGQPGNARLLLKKGAHVNDKNNKGWTPLMYALRYGQPENARLLMEKGAIINVKNITTVRLKVNKEVGLNLRL